ncbi:MAG TPA: hypothetical protein VK195_18580 [Burkholderiaceae bacterium]|nr:hypothetical protein [Burkholderiaceae bacterium]
MNMKWQAIGDAIWPTLDGGLEENERAERQKELDQVDDARAKLSAYNGGETELKDLLSASVKLLDDEHTRKTGVEARLLSVAGMGSIAATVVLGTLFTLATEKSLGLTPLARVPLALGATYLAVQLVAALHASVTGLMSRGYDVLVPADLVPASTSSSKVWASRVYYRRRIADVLDLMVRHRGITNKKLDQLNLAHRAMRNFLWGLLFMAAVGCLAALTVHPPETSGQHAVLRDADEHVAIAGPRAASAPLPPAQVSSAVTEVSMSILTIFTGMGLVALGVGLVIFGAGRPRRIVGGLAALAGLALTLTGHAKFEGTAVKLDKLIGELRFELSFGSKGGAEKVVLRRLVTVGPFPGGEHVLAKEGLADCVRQAVKQYGPAKISGWEVVGRVDKRNLKPEKGAVYGSNQALAMARANWVATELLNHEPSFSAAHVVTLVGGARETGQVVGDSELTSDRVVDVFVLVAMPTGDHTTEAGPRVCRPIQR